MSERLHIRRALDGALTRPLPVGYGLCAEARLGIVVREQLRLCLADLGKARLHHLGNALMVLLAGTAQQSLIGRLLDQGMLEGVGRLRRQPC